MIKIQHLNDKMAGLEIANGLESGVSFSAIWTVDPQFTRPQNIFLCESCPKNICQTLLAKRVITA
eukprot:Seg6877.3 transcript_id=Seg6877.3/GoldUCD/mRNA.D3Y31 product="hypothetical protein" protein_id=Seg6877.3/GoldUCD/D3Y31